MSDIPEHAQTDECGFDRNRSVCEDRYCCMCGWPFDAQIPPSPAAPAPDDLVDRLRQLIEGAPHSAYCEAPYTYTYALCQEHRQCSCWKAEASSLLAAHERKRRGK